MLKRISTLVVSLAVLGFLLGVSAASAAPNHQSTLKGTSKPRFHQVGPVQGKKVQDKQTFLESLGDGSCQSSCCYAWVEGCDEGGFSCSNVSCSFYCDGTSGTYNCSAT